jgi:hypothetical protein
VAPTTWSELGRPGLRSGLRVVRRDDHHLQIGLDPPDRLVLPDTPGLREALTGADRHPPEDLLPVLDRLVRDGWVVDVGERARERPAPAPRPVALTVDAALDRAVLRACAVAGLVPATSALVRLVATAGEPRRDVSDALVRDDTAHLWLTALPGRLRVGPYVEPGRTACLRCVDAHLGDADPRRATVLHQLEELPPDPGADLDPCLVRITVAWAVRDVVRRLDGRRPSLTSATVTVTDDLEVIRREWLRHPHCGCAWG